MTWELVWTNKGGVWISNNPEKDMLETPWSKIEDTVKKVVESQRDIHRRMNEVEQDIFSIMESQVRILEILEKQAIMVPITKEDKKLRLKL